TGWFEPEQSAGRTYRWAAGQAAAVVRVAGDVSSARIAYRLPPRSSSVTLTVQPLDQPVPIWSTHLSSSDSSWREASLPMFLERGDYLLMFDADRVWSN